MDFMDAMALGKDNAKRDRDRGGSAVRVFATSKALYEWQGPEHDAAEVEARHRLRGAVIDAYEAVAFELLGHTWEGL